MMMMPFGDGICREVLVKTFFFTSGRNGSGDEVDVVAEVLFITYL